LKDPKWPRNDIHASLRNFREHQKSPEVSSINVVYNTYAFFRCESARCGNKWYKPRPERTTRL